FDMPAERLEVLIHPQSVVHSLVEYVDGSVLAQLGNPDMRVPIAHALGYPERIGSGATPLDLAAVGRLDFEAPDETRFPCLRLARSAMALGGTATAVLNAANEVAVAAFLDRAIRFTDIAAVIERALEAIPAVAADTLESVLAADAAGRRVAREAVTATAQA
ncbi:MAG: 1-deoxy-D-xylulose-5-phosphate reductoisomerase, partial [Gammaproteobacteria bacterium]|nr:1-deoxy-D-xylulose-5-phosphate reductoisomerase [Gammaproteobacteria bacterium]